MMDNSSMEVGVGSDAFKTDVSCIRSLLPCTGVLCKPITAGGFWAWVTHSPFPSSFPFSAHPSSFLGQQTEHWCIFKPVAVSWLSHGCSKGHFGFCMEGAVHGQAGLQPLHCRNPGDDLAAFVLSQLIKALQIILSVCLGSRRLSGLILKCYPPPITAWSLSYPHQHASDTCDGYRLCH